MGKLRNEWGCSGPSAEKRRERPIRLLMQTREQERPRKGQEQKRQSSHGRELRDTGQSATLGAEGWKWLLGRLITYGQCCSGVIKHRTMYSASQRDTGSEKTCQSGPPIGDKFWKTANSSSYRRERGELKLLEKGEGLESGQIAALILWLPIVER